MPLLLSWGNHVVLKREPSPKTGSYTSLKSQQESPSRKASTSPSLHSTKSGTSIKGKEKKTDSRKCSATETPSETTKGKTAPATGVTRGAVVRSKEPMVRTKEPPRTVPSSMMAPRAVKGKPPGVAPKSQSGKQPSAEIVKGPAAADKRRASSKGSVGPTDEEHPPGEKEEPEPSGASPDKESLKDAEGTDKSHSGSEDGGKRGFFDVITDFVSDVFGSDDEDKKSQDGDKKSVTSKVSGKSEKEGEEAEDLPKKPGEKDTPKKRAPKAAPPKPAAAPKPPVALRGTPKAVAKPPATKADTRTAKGGVKKAVTSKADVKEPGTKELRRDSKDGGMSSRTLGLKSSQSRLVTDEFTSQQQHLPQVPVFYSLI